MPSTNKRKGPSLRDEQRSFTRARLLRGAAEVISERGYSNTTISDITDHANASRATFYLHFKDKDDLLEALLAEVDVDVETYYSRLDAVVATRDRTTFREWVSDARQWFVDNEATVSAIEQYSSMGNISMESRLKPLIAQMPMYVAAWPGGAAQAGYRLVLGVDLLGAANVVWRNLGGPAQGLPEDEMIDVLADVMWGVLGLDRITVQPVRNGRKRAPIG